MDPLSRKAHSERMRLPFDEMRDAAYVSTRLGLLGVWRRVWGENRPD